MGRPRPRERLALPFSMTFGRSSPFERGGAESDTADSTLARSVASTLSPRLCQRFLHRMDQASALCVRPKLAERWLPRRALRRRAPMALDLILRECSARSLDDDLLLLAVALVPGRDIDDAVGRPMVERHLDLRHAARGAPAECPTESSLTERLVVRGPVALPGPAAREWSRRSGLSSGGREGVRRLWVGMVVVSRMSLVMTPTERPRCPSDSGASSSSTSFHFTGQHARWIARRPRNRPSSVCDVLCAAPCRESPFHVTFGTSGIRVWPPKPPGSLRRHVGCGQTPRPFMAVRQRAPLFCAPWGGSSTRGFELGALQA